MAWNLSILLAIAAPGDGERETPLADAIAISGTVSCLERENLAERVAAWSGHETVPAGAHIEIVHDADLIALKIAGIAEDEVVRTFAPPPGPCADVEVAVAVALAVALDGEAVARELDEEPVPPPAPEVAPAPTPAPAPAPARSAAASGSRRPALHLAFAAGGSIAVLPRAGLEIASELQVRWPRIAIVAGLDLGASPAMPLGPGRADAVRIAAHAGVCVPVERGRFGLGLCAIAIGGPTIATARGIAVPRTDVVPWFATIARLELSVAVSPRWALVLGNDLVTAWVRPAIAADDPGPGDDARLRTPPVGWRGLFGARVRLGGRSRSHSPRRGESNNSTSAAKRSPAAGMDGVG